MKERQTAEAQKEPAQAPPNPIAEALKSVDEAIIAHVARGQAPGSGLKLLLSTLAGQLLGVPR
jgi:hypothetical protein